MIIVNARFLTQKVTGVQRFAIEISKILRKLDPDIVFVAPGDILDKELANELGVTVIGLNTGTIWEQIDLRRYLSKIQESILVNFCNTGLLFYRKQIVTIHDMSYKVNPEWFSRGFYSWYNVLIPNLVKYSSKIFTVSNAAKKDIIQYLKINPGKISVIYNSSNLNTNDNFEQIYREKYILSVSSLEPRKNLNNLIAAFNQLDQKIKLVIVGMNTRNFSFKHHIINDNIDIKGYVSDIELVNLIKNAEAFVYLSFYEGFGLPPLEAMSCGCAVVVSDIESHREICGKAAVYADPFNVTEIRDKINEILSNNQLRQYLINEGKENIKRFDWFTSAKKVLYNINEIVKEYK